MLCVKKTIMSATAISQEFYNNLITIAKEKNISLSELIIMAVSMQLNRQNIEIKKNKRTSDNKKIITVRVSEGLFDIVDNISKKYSCSRSRFVLDAIEYGLNYVKKGGF